MNFGEALEALKQGKRVERTGWNGKGMWLALVSPDPGFDAPRSAEPVDGYYRVFLGPQEPGRPRGLRDGLTSETRPALLPWIGMKTADDGFVPWLASQTDLLAEDWAIVGEVAPVAKVKANKAHDGVREEERQRAIAEVNERCDRLEKRNRQLVAAIHKIVTGGGPAAIAKAGKLAESE